MARRALGAMLFIASAVLAACGGDRPATAEPESLTAARQVRVTGIRIPGQVLLQGIGSPRPSQHPSAEEGVIQRQSGDCSYCGDAGAINEVEAGYPIPTEKREKPAADHRTNDAEQDIDDGSFARGADDLTGDTPECKSQENPDDHRHEAPPEDETKTRVEVKFCHGRAADRESG